MSLVPVLSVLACGSAPVSPPTAPPGLSFADAGARLDGPSDLVGAGTVVAGAEDLDGDGVDDLVVASAAVDGEVPAAVFVVPGPLEGRRALDVAATAQRTDITCSTQYTFTYLCEDVGLGPIAGAGDLNADGAADLVVGEPRVGGSDYTGPEGRTLVYFGPIGVDGLETPDFEYWPQFGSANGSVLAAAGDVDGDGFGDLLTSTNPGAMLLYGPFTGPGIRSARLRTIHPVLAVAALGAADFDGDGLDDAVLGLPGYDGIHAFGYGQEWGPGPDPGAVAVALGPQVDTQILDDVASWWVGETDGDLTGQALAAGEDLDGDGAADLVIGAPGHQHDSAHPGGAVYVAAGPLDVSIPAHATRAELIAAGPDDAAGVAVAAGDVDGDGVGDLLVGAPGTDGRGAAYLVFGPLDGVRDLADADVRMNGSPGSAAGASVALADLDGDALEDAVLGAPGGAGSVVVFFGGAL